MCEKNIRIGRSNEMLGIVGLTTGPMKLFIWCRLLDAVNVRTHNGKHELLTQKEISCTRAAFFRSGSASLICLNVSIVFGCMPSAFPVEVLSGRSSRMTTSIPYRARLHLIPSQYTFLGKREKVRAEELTQASTPTGLPPPQQPLWKRPQDRQDCILRCLHREPYFTR